MGKPESTVELYLKQKAEEKGYLCYKFVSPGHTGVPDRIVIGNGKTIFVETKAPNGVLRKKQEITIRRMRQNGATVYVAYSRDQVDSLLLELDAGNQGGVHAQIKKQTDNASADSNTGG